MGNYDETGYHDEFRDHRKVAEFEGGHKLHGVVWFQETECKICKNETTCLCSDASENEYRFFSICNECSKKLFDEENDRKLKSTK